MPYLSETSPIILGGCGSSGTTVIRVTLESHPRIFCGPESTVFLSRVTSPSEIAKRYGFEAARIVDLQRRSRSQAEFIDLFQMECLRAASKDIWAEKTPKNVTRLDFLFRHFPNSRFVHIIRDGRDVVCSLLTRPWMKLPEGSRGTPHAIEVCISSWENDVSAGLKHQDDPRYCEVYYEDFVHDTETTMRRLLADLGIEWSDQVMECVRDTRAPLDRSAMYRPKGAAGSVYTSSVGRWQTDLSAQDADIIKRVAGKLLIDLGYATDFDWVPAVRASSDRF